MIRILDYGMGNLRSVEKAIQHLGGDCEISTNVGAPEKLIIPGVGAFGAAMERLLPLKKEIQAVAASGTPVLGICLGQQLLFEQSEELGNYKGLELVPGRVVYLPRNAGLKVPHIGWSPLTYRHTHGLCAGGESGEQVYFVHSLVTECAEPADIAATAEYGVTFAAMVQRANIWGAQFHPEKSSRVGLRMLSRFIEL